MNEFPFPKRRASWFAALILTVISFICYYGFFYNDLQNYYYDQLYKVIVNVEIECDTVSSLDKLLITVRYPKFVTNFVQRWVYLQIKNTDNENQINESFNLSINIPVEEYQYGNLLSTNWDNVKNSNDSLQFEKIQPNETLYGRIPFVVSRASSSSKKDDLLPALVINGKKCNLGSENTPEYSSFVPLVDSLIETVLLPPWSNRLIPLIAIFFCYVLEYRGDKGKKRENSNINIFSLINCLSTLIGGIGLMLLLVAGLELLVSQFKLSCSTFGKISLGTVLLIIRIMCIPKWVENCPITNPSIIPRDRRQNYFKNFWKKILKLENEEISKVDKGVNIEASHIPEATPKDPTATRKIKNEDPGDTQLEESHEPKAETLNPLDEKRGPTTNSNNQSNQPSYISKDLTSVVTNKQEIVKATAQKILRDNQKNEKRDTEGKNIEIFGNNILKAEKDKQRPNADDENKMVEKTCENCGHTGKVSSYKCPDCGSMMRVKTN